MPNERFWRFVIVAVLVAAALTACDREQLSREGEARVEDQCRGYLSVARSMTDTLAILNRGAGWSRIDGSACAEIIGRAQRTHHGDTSHVR